MQSLWQASFTLIFSLVLFSSFKYKTKQNIQQKTETKTLKNSISPYLRLFLATHHRVFGIPSVSKNAASTHHVNSPRQPNRPFQLTDLPPGLTKLESQRNKFRFLRFDWLVMFLGCVRDEILPSYIGMNSTNPIVIWDAFWFGAMTFFSFRPKPKRFLWFFKTGVDGTVDGRW